MPHKPRIRKLSQILSKSLLPEMLLEEYDNNKSKAASSVATATSTTTGTTAATTATNSSCHPVVIARDFGLLNLSRIHRTTRHQGHPHSNNNNKNNKRSSTKESQSSSRSAAAAAAACHSSPTGVIHHTCYWEVVSIQFTSIQSTKGRREETIRDCDAMESMYYFQSIISLHTYIIRNNCIRTEKVQLAS